MIAPIRHGHRVTRRRPLKVVLSSEFLRSANARVAAYLATFTNATIRINTFSRS